MYSTPVVKKGDLISLFYFVKFDNKFYLQPKKGKAKEETHLVKSGQTMWEISQIHGVKLKKLYKKNRMLEGDAVKAGEKVYLRSKKSL